MVARVFQGMSRDLFSPPLSQQRSHYLAGIAFGSAVGQLVDLGCGDGALLQVLKAQVRHVMVMKGRARLTFDSTLTAVDQLVDLACGDGALLQVLKTQASHIKLEVRPSLTCAQSNVNAADCLGGNPAASAKGRPFITFCPTWSSTWVSDPADFSQLLMLLAKLPESSGSRTTRLSQQLTSSHVAGHLQCLHR